MTFKNSSVRTKRLKCKEIEKNIPLPQLAYAASMHLHASGHRSASNLVKDLTHHQVVQANMRELINLGKIVRNREK